MNAPSIVPRGLNRRESAQYVGVGVTKFDEMVADGRMPAPKEIDARRVWDRHKIDAAFEALPNTGDAEGGENQWDGVAE